MVWDCVILIEFGWCAYSVMPVMQEQEVVVQHVQLVVGVVVVKQLVHVIVKQVAMV